MPATPEIRLCRGADIVPWLDDVARLRLAVFRIPFRQYEEAADGQ